MPKTLESPRSAIQVIDRLGDLLNALMTNGGRASLKILAAETGLHPSTAFRILSSAVDNGWLDRNENGLYILGRHLIGLVQKSHTGLDVRSEALPLMRQLRQRLGETISLTFREGDAVIFAAQATGKRMLRTGMVIGRRAPLHVTAVGKLFLGSGGEEAVRIYANRHGLREYTHNTIRTADELVETALAAWQAGYALDNEEAEPGIACIGVPILNASGDMIAGLSISTSAKRCREEWVEELRACGIAVSARLGYTTAI